MCNLGASLLFSYAVTKRRGHTANGISAQKMPFIAPLDIGPVLGKNTISFRGNLRALIFVTLGVPRRRKISKNPNRSEYLTTPASILDAPLFA
jgi:hypothetical protein